MTAPRRAATSAAPLVASFALLFGGCADDANDHADRARRADLLAEDVHSTATVPEADGSVGSTPPPDAPAETVEPTGVVVPVVALDNSFRPQVVEVGVGDEVRWENRGLNEHNVLQVEGDGWGVEVDGFQPGAVYGHVFTEPGEYRYYCSIHGSTEVGMVGTVVVTG